MDELLIVPLFALANAGIQLDGALLADAVSSPITLGILLGYVVGKPAGILIAAWLASTLRLGGLRLTISWPVLSAGSVVAGIGFTVSLLISSIAFRGQQLEEAKLGVLAAAVVAPLGAWAAFRLIAPAARRRCGPARSSAPRDDLLDLADDVDPTRDHIRGPRGRARHPARVRRLRVPVLRPGRGRRPRAADSFGDDLRYVWRHLPLNDVHPHAQMAAEAAEAAAEQGEFWPMHDLLLAHQDELAPADLAATREELGLDVDRFWNDAARARARRAHRRGRRQRRRAAAWPARRRSSSTAAATRAPTTSTRSAPRSARRAPAPTPSGSPPPEDRCGRPFAGGRTAGLRVRGRQRERERLAVGARAQRVGAVDVLAERRRRRVVGHRAGVGQQRQRRAADERERAGVRPWPAAPTEARTRR